MAVIGIDLGTTNSLAAIWKDGKSIIIPNSTGKNLTPSVVSIDENKTILVGETAKERQIAFPEYTASCFKRTMGQPYFYTLGDENFNSTDLSSFVLQSLKRDAEKYLGEEVTEAVISVPAYFNQNQRKATKDAAELIGLKVERLVSEPTAAAICYGVQNMEDMSTIMVFDLGGGTFDVSLLELFDGVIDVKAVSGDNHLGGEDFTKSIIAWFLTVNNIGNNISNKELSMLTKSCEIAKRVISGATKQTAISAEIGGKTYNTLLNYETFKAITQDLIERLKTPINKVLSDSSTSLEEIDAVILMGGSTRMNLVREFVENELGVYTISSYNPDETVALGAATLAAMKTHNEELKETVLTDICPFTLGTAISAPPEMSLLLPEGKLFSPIIERNSPVPISIVKQYCTSRIGQTEISLEVYQGEEMDPAKNLFLGKMDLTVPLNNEDNEVIDVRFTYDINGLLEVETTVLSTKEVKSIILAQKNQNLTDEEIAAAKERLKQFKTLPWEEEEVRLLLERGQRLYAEATGEERNKILTILEDYNKTLLRQNPKEIKEKTALLKKLFNRFEEW